jgi:hypothetical protein
MPSNPLLLFRFGGPTQGHDATPQFTFKIQIVNDGLVPQMPPLARGINECNCFVPLADSADAT